MKTEILYCCEHCGRAKNTDENLMKIHELYCPHNLKALPPKTEAEYFDVASNDTSVEYCETISLDEWIDGGFTIDQYSNELEVFLLNGKKLLECWFNRKDRIYPFCIDGIAYSVSQLKSFGKVEVVVYTDYSD